MNIYPVTNYVSRAYPSCFGVDQALRLADGQCLSAGLILRAVERGFRIDAHTNSVYVGDATHTGLLSNPVIAACATRGDGYKITLDGGRTLTLTGAHRLLRSEPELTTYREGKESIPVQVQDVTRADEVRAGDCLADGVVVCVEPLGEIAAVRIWTADPAWLFTGDGVRVGSRWHECELANGWLACDGERRALTMPRVLPHLLVQYDETARGPGYGVYVEHDGPCSWRDGLAFASQYSDNADETRSALDQAILAGTSSRTRIDDAVKIRRRASQPGAWLERARDFNRPFAGLSELHRAVAIRRDASDGTARGLVMSAR